MEIPQIKDKITARAFTLAMAVKYRIGIAGTQKYSLIGNTVEQAGTFEKYLIGDADLPEVAEDPTNKVLNIWDKVRESTEPKIEDMQNETN